MKKWMLPGLAIVMVAFGANAATVDFATQIQPIFNANCIRCHGGVAGLFLDPGVSYNNLVGVVSQNYAPAIRVKLGDPTNSVLYNKVDNTGVYGGVMPKDTGKMPQANIDLIASWIAPSPTTTACTATLDGGLSLHIPYIAYVTPSGTLSLGADFVYAFNPQFPASIIFKLTTAGIIADPSVSCAASTLSGDLKIQIPDLLLPDGTTHLRVDLEYDPALSIGGNFYWVVTAFLMN